MKNSEKIEILNKYTLSDHKTVELITQKNIIVNLPIPDFWKRAFLTDDFEKRKSIIIAEWERYALDELSNTILYLKTGLKNIELMKIGDEYSILYSLVSYRTKKELFYEGKCPITNQLLCSTCNAPIDTIDKSIVNFYTKLHNGFYYYPSKSMGLESINNVISMSELDWEYEDDLAIDLTNLYNFFSNGMGMYVVLDINQDIDSGAYLWSNKDLPKEDLNFWEVIDDWIVIGLDF